MNKKSVAQNYTFLGIMLGAMILGALFGWLAPSAAVAIKPLGTVFINMMFCIVVPLVFASISGAVANMKSRKRAGKIMGTTIATFVVTGAIARSHHVPARSAVPAGAHAVDGASGRGNGRVRNHQRHDRQFLHNL